MMRDAPRGVFVQASRIAFYVSRVFLVDKNSPRQFDGLEITQYALVGKSNVGGELVYAESAGRSYR
jgi:hypothetical protein